MPSVQILKQNHPDIFGDMSDGDAISLAKQSGMDAWDDGQAPSDNGDGDFVRGFTNDFKQLPVAGYGLLAGAAATVEAQVGSGGLWTDAKDAALGAFEDRSAKLAQTSKVTDDWDTVAGRAAEGDYGSLLDFVQYGLGHAASQGLQAAVTGGVGAAIGKQAAFTLGRNLVESAVAKEVGILSAEAATASLAATEIERLAVANVSKKVAQLGSMGAMYTTATLQEGGEIGGGLAEMSKREDRTLTAEEIIKGFASTAVAGGLEGLGDKLGLDAVMGRGWSNTGANWMTRGIKGGVAAAPAQSATEFGQTMVEEYGKGNDPLSEETMKNARTGAAMGAIGGGAMGGVGSAIFGKPDIVDTILPASVAPVSIEPATVISGISDDTVNPVDFVNTLSSYVGNSDETLAAPSGFANEDDIVTGQTAPSGFANEDDIVTGQTAPETLTNVIEYNKYKSATDNRTILLDNVLNDNNVKDKRRKYEEELSRLNIAPGLTDHEVSRLSAYDAAPIPTETIPTETIRVAQNWATDTAVAKDLIATLRSGGYITGDQAVQASPKRNATITAILEEHAVDGILPKNKPPVDPVLKLAKQYTYQRIMGLIPDTEAEAAHRVVIQSDDMVQHMALRNYTENIKRNAVARTSTVSGVQGDTQQTVRSKVIAKNLNPNDYSIIPLNGTYHAIKKDMPVSAKPDTDLIKTIAREEGLNNKESRVKIADNLAQGVDLYGSQPREIRKRLDQESPTILKGKTYREIGMLFQDNPSVGVRREGIGYVLTNDDTTQDLPKGVGEYLTNMAKPHSFTTQGAAVAKMTALRQKETHEVVETDKGFMIKPREPARTEPARTEPTRTEPTRTEPTRAEPVRTEPTRTEPTRAEPVRAEPVRAEPVRTEPTSSDTVSSDPLASIPDDFIDNIKIQVESVTGKIKTESAKTALERTRSKIESYTAFIKCLS